MSALAGSVAAVVAAIQDEVGAEIERRQKELDAKIADASRESSAAGLPTRAESPRLAAAREEARERLAREDWLDSRESIEQREDWIQRALGEGIRRLQEREEGPEGPEILFRLAAEGISRLPGESCEVAVAERAALKLDDEWLGRLRDHCGKKEIRFARPDLGRPEGGCLLRTPDGRFNFDNSLAARSRRFEAQWRSALTRLYG